jgi:hypothetical protein
MNEIVKKYLLIFVFIVKQLEKELTTQFDLQDIPYNEVNKKIPKKGTFNWRTYLVSFDFHGAGCLFKINNLELDYNIGPLSENNIKISPWKFLNFLKTYPKVESEINNLDQELLFNILIEFEKAKILNKIPESMGTFEICEPWIKNNLISYSSIETIFSTLSSPKDSEG